VHPQRPIVDVVLGVASPEPLRAVVMAACAGVGALALLGLWALDLDRRPRLAREPAARIPVEISLDETTEPRRPPPVPPALPEREAAPRRPSARHISHPSDARAPEAELAQAATVVGRDPSGPVDLTSETVVVGAANAYAGGATQTQGKGTAPASPRPASGDSAAGLGPPVPVGLATQSWSCPWPSEAEAIPIDEETVVIRVVVRPDGSTESVTIVSEPGHGFGDAAATCAMRTRFTPARAAGGQPLRAWSPPIRVRFTR
jgi:protein TonB